MHLSTVDNSVSLMFFLLDPLTSAFIKADLRRQKANKETPENVCMWELAGLTSGSLAEDGAAQVGLGGSQSSHLTDRTPESPPRPFAHCLPAAPSRAPLRLPSLLLASLLWSSELSPWPQSAEQHPPLPRLLSPVLGSWLRCFQPGVSAGQDRWEPGCPVLALVALRQRLSWLVTVPLVSAMAIEGPDPMDGQQGPKRVSQEAGADGGRSGEPGV